MKEWAAGSTLVFGKFVILTWPFCRMVQETRERRARPTMARLETEGNMPEGVDGGAIATDSHKYNHLHENRPSRQGTSVAMHVYTHRRVLGNRAVAIDGKTVLPKLWRCPRPCGNATVQEHSASAFDGGWPWSTRLIAMPSYPRGKGWEARSPRSPEKT